MCTNLIQICASTPTSPTPGIILSQAQLFGPSPSALPEFCTYTEVVFQQFRWIHHLCEVKKEFSRFTNSDSPRQSASQEPSPQFPQHLLPAHPTKFFLAETPRKGTVTPRWSVAPSQHKPGTAETGLTWICRGRAFSSGRWHRGGRPAWPLCHTMLCQGRAPGPWQHFPALQPAERTARKPQKHPEKAKTFNLLLKPPGAAAWPWERGELHQQSLGWRSCLGGFQPSSSFVFIFRMNSAAQQPSAFGWGSLFQHFASCPGVAAARALLLPRQGAPSRAQHVAPALLPAHIWGNPGCLWGF